MRLVGQGQPWVGPSVPQPAAPLGFRRIFVLNWGCQRLLAGCCVSVGFNGCVATGGRAGGTVPSVAPSCSGGLPQTSASTTGTAWGRSRASRPGAGPLPLFSGPCQRPCPRVCSSRGRAGADGAAPGAGLQTPAGTAPFRPLLRAAAAPLCPLRFVLSAVTRSSRISSPRGARGAEALEELKMSGAASYEQLVRQVEALRRENSHLRRELQDNSQHLSKLENETSDMKEVLKHLQGKLEQEARVMVSSGQTEVLEQLKALQMDVSSLYSLKFPEVAAGAGEDSPQHGTAHGDSAGDGGRATLRLLEELDRERCFLLGEIEKEEKEKVWYYAQLQSLSKRLEELPHVETFSMQMDLIRQQLQFEAQHIRALMEERFGTADEMVQRAQIRASRLEQIDKELMEAQDKVQPPEPQLCTKLPGTEEDMDVPTHPEDGGSSKVEVVFWLLSMLATRDKDDMSRTLLAMSSSQESCLAMRKSGCLPLLIQILHDSDREPGPPESPSGAKDARMRANAALHNIVFSQPDEGQAKKEMRVLHVLEQIRSYSETCWDWLQMQSRDGGKGPEGSAAPVPIEPQICQATCAIMKLSFDEEYRRAMNELGKGWDGVTAASVGEQLCVWGGLAVVTPSHPAGGLQAVAELLQVDYEMHKMTSDPLNLALRRYAGMALTNLTFGDVVNKATLCSRRGCMEAIVAQLGSDSEELHQVVSSILRNLSWRADINSKKVLREVGSVAGLTQCALHAAKESTLKSVLSALWNLSAHSTENKAAICGVEGALGFLVSTLTYKCQSNSLAIIESGGGILRNVSSLIATREDYRQVLRDHNCLQTLLQHLRSHSLTIVSNACGTLWNLSARSPRDQELLWDLGAVSMLRNLIHSKHKMIAMGSAAALRNLLTNRPPKYKDAAVVSPGSCMPSLYMRKQKALEAELDAKHLAETFDTMEKQSLKSQSAKKPLRHMESLVKDYASDSGCFDDDEVPNISTGVETASASVLSMFLGSSFLQGQALPRALAQRRCPEPEKDDGGKMGEPKKPPLPEDDVSLAAEKLANKISSTVAKIDKLVEDISTMHTSSDDSFSLSSEDHGLDWQYGPEEPPEVRAHSCSPCRLSDTGGSARREGLSRARALLRLKTAYTSLSTDSLNSGSTSDGYCPKEHMKPCTRAPFLDYRDELQRYQKRPSRLDLKSILGTKPEPTVLKAESDKPEQREPPERGRKAVTFPSPKALEPGRKKETGGKLPTDPQVHTIKLSPSYQHVPLLGSLAKSSTAISHHPSLLGRKQAWLPPGLLQTADTLSKIPEKLPAQPPAAAEQESVQKYSVEDTPICFSRCSSLSSLSSADNVLDGQSHSENDLDSDSSLEILEMDEGDGEAEDVRQEKEKAEPGPTTPVGISQPIAIPFPKRDKLFLRDASPSRQEDHTPSSSSENYIQETPLVMSRCSSVSSLGSFESPSIASSIQSDPCSEMISGTVSPSELPDSPGQTMPPSRSKTPLFELGCPPEKETSQFNIQWENNVKKFMEITDFKERFQLPQDLDSMVYFTVEKPNENFSCASSLSALPLHEHYVQKDVELKLMPTFPEKNSLNFAAHEEREEREEQLLEGRHRAEPSSDDDIEILKECISSAMPSRFRKVKSSLLSGQVLHPHTKKPVHVPVYMLVPAHAAVPKHLRATARELYKDDDSITDSAEGTPVNFSSAASLSDETLRGPKEEAEPPRGVGRRREVGAAASPARRSALGSAVPTRPSSACRGRVGSSRDSPVPPGRSAEGKRGQPVPGTEPEVGRSGSPGTRPCSLPRRKDGVREDGAAFQSLCHTTPTEEAVYCFYEHDSDEPGVGREVPGGGAQPGRALRRERCGGSVPRREPETKGKAKSKLQHNLIADETPPCYSLSSSMSSLSDGNPGEGEERGSAPRQRAAAGQAQGRSPSPNSEDDLLQKCIGSAMPKRRRPSMRRRTAERKQKLKGSTGRERAAEGRHRSEDVGSDGGSDLDSVEWEAIQEGANSIVTWLHQAAASLSREPSSESDSILSFVSGLSVGSTLQLSLDRTEKKRSGSAAGREAERRERAKSRPEGKKAPSARPAGNTRAERSPAPSKPVPNLPVVFRGRTVIYMPSLAKDAPSPRSTPKKSPVAKPPAPKNLSLSQQRSRSLHRLGKPPEGGDLALPKRSTTPPARIAKGPPSSGSSRTSTPSQHVPKKLPSPSQLSKQSPVQTGKATSPPSPPGPPTKPTAPRSPAPRQHKTQKSPVRIPFMQKPSRKVLPVRAAMPVLEEQEGSGKAKGSTPGGAGSSRLNLVRMSSTRSSGSDSDRSGFLRQLTFIKESSSLLLRHRAELAPATSVTSLPRGASPQRSRAALPTVFLCSSRCEELKAAKPAAPAPRPLVPRAQPGCKTPAASKPPRRTSSESPSRLPVKTAVPEPFKRYSSSPNISVPRRTGSPSSVLSACSEASARRRKPGEATEEKPPMAMMKGTWRRIRDEDIPHILQSTLPSTALPLLSAAEEPSPGPRKTSDAVVQTEDFATTKTNSSTSPTMESPRRDGEAPAPAKTTLPISFGHEAPAGAFPASRHSSPSRAARVTPFNYVPSPMAVPAVADKAVEKIQA
ncbi:adenomatous polyposis coli protein 2 isoform X3 [Numida meleagris]|uniref:adenomatous polyposis coli protein 2 isoform X3 n=1 Tax=Numida meleagris TaxID=8996 RepID=UPI000B3E1867|nr:adenomatous polyposis coli protein 2 isoform X3 [Numida meleagris]